MELNQLRQFQVIAETEHMTKASCILHVAQPALSKTIKLLETELNTELFDRKGKKIRLNENGRILLKYTDRILKNIDNIYKEIDEVHERYHHEVNLSMRIATKLIPQLLVGFHKKHPEIKVSITQKHEAQLDVFASTKPIKDSNYHLLIKEQLLLAVPIDHPIIHEKEVRLDMLEKDDFICVASGQSLGDLTVEFCSMAGFEPNIILESDSPSIVRDLVKYGFGVSIFPEISWTGVEDNNIKLLPIDYPKCTRYFYLYCDDAQYQSIAILKLKEYIIQFFTEIAAQKTHSEG